MAPQVGTYNVSNIRELQGLMGQFGQFGGSCEASSWFNSAFDVAGNLEQIDSGSAEQKASGIQNLINKALSLVEKITNQESQVARKEVKTNSENTQKLNSKSENAKAEITRDFNGIASGISEEEGVIKAANEEIAKAQEEIAKKQKEIEEKVNQINDAQKALAGTTNKTEQKDLLDKISRLSGEIAQSVESIATIQQIVEDASAEVADSVSYIESLKGNAVEIQENGETKIQQLSQEAAKNVQANTQTQTKAVINQATGEGAKNAAQVAATNVLTGTSVAPKLYRVAIDQELAGTTRNAGAAANLTHLLQGIGKINDNASLLQSFNTSIGSALNSYKDYVGEWNKRIPDVITSLGSFDGENGINSQLETLNTAIKTDNQTLGNGSNNKGGSNEKADNKDKKEDTKEEVKKLETPGVKFGI